VVEADAKGLFRSTVWMSNPRAPTSLLPEARRWRRRRHRPALHPQPLSHPLLPILLPPPPHTHTLLLRQRRNRIGSSSGAQSGRPSSVSSTSFADVVRGRSALVELSPKVSRREGKAPMGDEGTSRRSPEAPSAPATNGTFMVQLPSP
jgi:hypothetical protein